LDINKEIPMADFLKCSKGKWGMKDGQPDLVANVANNGGHGPTNWKHKGTNSVGATGDNVANNGGHGPTSLMGKDTSKVGATGDSVPNGSGH
jgi:hypothetical protein